MLLIAFQPGPLARLVNSLLALWELALVAVSLATLAGFFYWFFLRRIMRARRIANARLARLLRESADHQNAREER